MSFGSFGGNQDHVCYIQLWWFFLFLVCWANVLLQPKTRETIKSLHYCIDRKHPTHQPSSAGLSLPPPISPSSFCRRTPRNCYSLFLHEQDHHDEAPWRPDAPVSFLPVCLPGASSVLRKKHVLRPRAKEENTRALFVNQWMHWFWLSVVLPLFWLEGWMSGLDCHDSRRLTRVALWRRWRWISIRSASHVSESTNA